MCNCNKPKPPKPPTASGLTQSFTLTDRSGKIQTFGSRLEAEAANIRAGRTGMVKPAGQ